MIDKVTAIDTVLTRLEKLEPGHCLDLRTYKRNRSVVIKKMDPDTFLLVRDGYGQERFEVPLGRLKKTLKQLFKREFPRSTKLRLYTLGPCDPEEKLARKTL
jgi:hypothetical protein